MKYLGEVAVEILGGFGATGGNRYDGLEIGKGTIGHSCICTVAILRNIEWININSLETCAVVFMGVAFDSAS